MSHPKRFLAILTSMLWTSSVTHAQVFDEWLNNRIQEAVAVRLNIRSNTRQVETPTMSGNSTSLVDQSSVSDLVGVAINLAELSGVSADGTDTTSVSATVTGYAVYAALRGADPLSPSFYNNHRNWRRVSVTLGYDNQQAGGGEAVERATLVGVKVQAWDRRDVSHPAHQETLDTISRSLTPAASAFAQLTEELQPFLYGRFVVTAPGLGFELPATAENEDKFDGLLGDSDQFPLAINTLDEFDLIEIDRIIASKLQSFLDLTTTARRAIESIRRAPQLSFAVQSKFQKEGADVHLVEGIFDLGVHPRINFTANGSYEYQDNSIEDDVQGGRVAGQLELRLSPETLVGRKPLIVGFAGEASWREKMENIFKGQVKLKIPIAAGIDFPVSFTFANRTDLIDEAEVRGQFGFTFDITQLVTAF